MALLSFLRLTRPDPGDLPGIPVPASAFETLAGPDAFRRRLLELIAQARTRILLSVLYLQDDEAGREVLHALYAAKALHPQPGQRRPLPGDGQPPGPGCAHPRPARADPGAAGRHAPQGLRPRRPGAVQRRQPQQRLPEPAGPVPPRPLPPDPQPGPGRQLRGAPDRRGAAGSRRAAPGRQAPHAQGPAARRHRPVPGAPQEGGLCVHPRRSRPRGRLRHAAARAGPHPQRAQHSAAPADPGRPGTDRALHALLQPAPAPAPGRPGAAQGRGPRHGHPRRPCPTSTS